MVAVVVITVALRNLQPAPPSVDASTVWTDTVKRGTMVRQVRGPGTLVPEEMRYITAVTAGRIEQIHVEPGTEVAAGTDLLQLANPDVEVEALQAQRQLTDARSSLVTLRTNLQNQILSQEGVVATVRAQYQEAMRNARNNERLKDRVGELIAADELSRSRERAAELETRLGVEEKRLEVLRGSLEEQLAVQEEQVERFRSIHDFHRNRVASMNVRSPVDGVLAELPFEEGQWANPGAMLARVVKPGRLKAEVNIPQTQARDVAIGQPALVDTRNDTIDGRVARIDPAVNQNGTVTVDVTLTEELPRGARPDLSVDGTIEVDRIDETLYVGRPAYGQANSTVGLFRLAKGGEEAVRVNVRLGRSSVNTIEILQGLQEGDVVILSDMSAWDEYDRVRLN